MDNKISSKMLLFQFIKDRKLHYIGGIILLIICTVSSGLVPMYLGKITDALKEASVPKDHIYRDIILMFLFTLLVFILKYVWRYLLIGNCRYVECYLREKYFSHLQRLPLSFFNQHRTGDLMALSISDIQAIRISMGFGTVASLEGVAVNVVTLFFIITTMNPILTLIALAPVPFIVFVMVKLRKEIRKRFINVQECFTQISGTVQENISGIRVIKSFARENEEIDNLTNLNSKKVDAALRLTKVSAALGPAGQILFGLSFFFYISLGGYLTVNSTISIGDFVAFNSYMALIMQPVLNIARIMEVWQKSLASMKRLDEVFSQQPEADIEPDNKSDAKNRIKGKLVIRNLNFSYPDAGQIALKNINLIVPQGSTLGILGRTGSGKTTLANLLLRLHPVDDGMIFIDDIDINKMSLETIRDSIGFVPQDNFMFSASVKENIEFFSNIYSDEQIERAARLAAVYDNIADFPEGFDTLVGEQGVTLSGGQKQRIALARALIKAPSILILDDSLSAVDTQTEEEILTNIKNVLSDRTGIIIAHRVSTVMNCDNIIYMEDGKIVESGTHDELMKLQGRYYRLYIAQQEGKNYERQG